MEESRGSEEPGFGGEAKEKTNITPAQGLSPLENKSDPSLGTPFPFEYGLSQLRPSPKSICQAKYERLAFFIPAYPMKSLPST